MYDFGRRYTGYQQYRPSASKKPQNNPKDGRYYSYVTKGEIALFGLESWDFSEVVYLVGGLFKATTLHRLGYSALHVSSVSHYFLKSQLRLLGRPYLAIGDNDDEGRQFARRYGGWTSPCDVDEMSDKDVHMMVHYETGKHGY